jgi:hypothetical protein
MNFRQDDAWNSGGDWVMHVAWGPIWFGGAAILCLALGIFLVGVTDVYERYEPLLRGRTFILVAGEVQRASGAISVLVTQAIEFNDTQADAKPPQN